LLAVNATLVTTTDLHPALRDLLLRAADTVFSDATVLSGVDEFPKPVGSEFTLAAEASRYYEFGPPLLQRYLPFWIANLVTLISQRLTIRPNRIFMFVYQNYCK